MSIAVTINSGSSSEFICILLSSLNSKLGAEDHRPATEESQSTDSRKAAFRLRLRAGPVLRTAYGIRTHYFHWWKTAALPSGYESVNAQDDSSELLWSLLA